MLVSTYSDQPTAVIIMGLIWFGKRIKDSRNHIVVPWIDKIPLWA